MHQRQRRQVHNQLHLDSRNTWLSCDVKRGEAGVEQVLLLVMLLGLGRQGGNSLDLLFKLNVFVMSSIIDEFISCITSPMLRIMFLLARCPVDAWGSSLMLNHFFARGERITQSTG